MTICWRLVTSQFCFHGRQNFFNVGTQNVQARNLTFLKNLTHCFHRSRNLNFERWLKLSSIFELVARDRPVAKDHPTAKDPLDIFSQTDYLLELACNHYFDFTQMRDWKSLYAEGTGGFNDRLLCSVQMPVHDQNNRKPFNSVYNSQVLDKDRSKVSSDKSKKPNMDQLTRVQNLMTDEIRTLLFEKHEYRIYTKDIIFENNWDINNPYTVIGISAYVLKVVKARMYIHFKYAKVKVSVLSSSVDEDASSVYLRWRVSGLRQAKAFMFWKYKPLKFRKTGDDESEWLDGLSTFYVSIDGFIYKHKIDRVIPDRAEIKTDKLEEDGSAPAT